LFESLPEKAVITKNDIHIALGQVLSARKGKMEEYLTHFTDAELEVLIAFAKMGPIEKPSGKNFLQKLNVSKAAVTKIVSKFLNQAILYNENKTFSIADPLLFHHLNVYR
jgi:hypothetical protein